VTVREDQVIVIERMSARISRTLLFHAHPPFGCQVRSRVGNHHTPSLSRCPAGKRRGKRGHRVRLLPSLSWHERFTLRVHVRDCLSLLKLIKPKPKLRNYIIRQNSFDHQRNKRSHPATTQPPTMEKQEHYHLENEKASPIGEHVEYVSDHTLEGPSTINEKALVRRT
jgi:hypothetical protein